MLLNQCLFSAMLIAHPISMQCFSPSKETVTKILAVSFSNSLDKTTNLSFSRYKTIPLCCKYIRCCKRTDMIEVDRIECCDHGRWGGDEVLALECKPFYNVETCIGIVVCSSGNHQLLPTI